MLAVIDSSKMLLTTIIALAAGVSAAPAIGHVERASQPTVYLAGDSTTALGGGGAGTQGRSPCLIAEDTD